jgi:hypothetical protein
VPTFAIPRPGPAYRLNSVASQPCTLRRDEHGAHRFCEDIIDIVLNNIRVTDERIGDIRAQLGALSVGERMLTQLLDRYSVETWMPPLPSSKPVLSG